MTNQGKLLIVIVLAIVGAGAGAYILLGGDSSEAPQEDLLEVPEFEEQAPIEESEQEGQMDGEEEGITEEEPTGEEEPGQEEEPIALITVNYTNSGFATASVNETAGITVRFKNQSSFNLEVSSDPHPTHTSCPQYNLAVVPPGGEVETTLTLGTCGIHNHLNPARIMSLTGN